MICAYPTATSKLLNITGNTIPPIEEEKAMIPSAVDSLFLNQ